MRTKSLVITIVISLTASVASAQAPAAPAPAEEAPPPVEVTPYGLLIFNSYFNTHDLANDDVPTAATGNDGTAFGMTLRQSRFGLKVASAPLAEALSIAEASAQLEVDFFGGYFTGNNITYSMSHPRLRLFFLRLKFNDTLSLTAGQDWVLASPLNPLSLNHMALVPFHTSGNLWNRLPQVRLDANVSVLKLSAGVMMPAGSGVAGNGEFSAVRDNAPPDRSSVPTLQARAGVAIPMGEDKLEAGVSGHFGMEEIALVDAMGMPTGVDETATSFAAILDLSIPIAGLLSIKGEAFYAQNMDGLFSLTGADPITGDETKSIGGWAQLVLGIQALSVGVGAGLERLMDDGGQNLALYVNAIYELADKLKVGLEFDHLRTTPAGDPAPATNTGNHINLSLHYGF